LQVRSHSCIRTGSVCHFFTEAAFSYLNNRKMKTYHLWKLVKKWLMRFAMAYMLGFANAINQETKSVDDAFTKIEEVLPDEKD
jgi:hypothetical protein